MASVTIHLKGWRDSALYAEAVNRPGHELHAEAEAIFHRGFLAYEPGDVMHTAITYETDLDDDNVICEDAFRRFNIGEQHDPLVRRYRRNGRRSLSVGDVVVIDGLRAYGCASFGWDSIEVFHPTESPR